ncbi:MAG: ABC transporter permease subunit [Verrucomicrobia bacterium]|nr:ABC transporter permease subunit [Verrucomicrobiota bacterium]
MRNIWILFKREMMSYFFSPIAYIVGVAVLLIMGGSFYFITYILSRQPGDNYTASQWFFNGFFFWIVMLVVPPVISMRLFADEQKSGTIETLMTAPLRDWEYVLAKFFGACVFFIVLWSPTSLYVFVLRHFSRDTTPLDLGPVVGGYIGVLLVAMLLISIGCMASASTRNQIIAAIIAFAIGGSLFLVGFGFFYTSDKYKEFFDYISMLGHMLEMSRGVLEWKRVIFYLSSSFFFLYLAHCMVQSRRWKN